MTSIEIAELVQQLNEVEQAIQLTPDCYELRKSQLSVLIEIMTRSVNEINDLKGEMRRGRFICGKCVNCKEGSDV